jgi:hypothetical protein
MWSNYTGFAKSQITLSKVFYRRSRFRYCYHSDNAITSSPSQSDHIKRLPLYFTIYRSTSRPLLPIPMAMVQDWMVARCGSSLQIVWKRLSPIWQQPLALHPSSLSPQLSIAPITAFLWRTTIVFRITCTSYLSGWFGHWLLAFQWSCSFILETKKWDPVWKVSCQTMLQEWKNYFRLG